MAFTGQALVTPVTDKLARITGLSLGSGAAGTISLFQGAGEVKLPDSLNWAPYGRFDDPNQIVDLVEAVQVYWTFPGDPGANYGPSFRVGVAKANGSDPAAFLITLTSFDASESVGAAMEIYVAWQ